MWSSLSKIPQNIWLLGDFNLSCIDWTNESLKSNCKFKVMYEDFMERTQNFNLQQMVTMPTRQENILDLFLTNTPSLVQNTETLPSLGTSDHDIVFHEVHIKIGRPFQPKRPIRLFANDVIIIGSVRADWLAPCNATIGNPRADKLGRNGFECIVGLLRCSVDRERCVLTTCMHSAIESYSMLHLQRWLACRGIKRSGTKSLFMIMSHNCQSYMYRQQYVIK